MIFCIGYNEPVPRRSNSQLRGKSIAHRGEHTHHAPTPHCAIAELQLMTGNDETTSISLYELPFFSFFMP